MSKSQSPLGRRLFIAFSAMLGLTLLVGLTSLGVWTQLSAQVSSIISESVPTINATYKLERASNRLLQLLGQLPGAEDEITLLTLERQITEAMGELENAYLVNLHSDDELARQQARFAELEALIQNQNQLLRHQLTLAQHLASQQKQLARLHQDLTDEMTPLLQEVAWHLSAQLGNRTSATTINSVLQEFSVLQNIALKENEIHQLSAEIINQRHQRELEHAFSFIGFQIDELRLLTTQLAAYPSTVSHRQILQELVELVKPAGALHQLLGEDVENQRQIKALQPQINELIQPYHAQVVTAVAQANTNLESLVRATNRQVSQGKAWLLLILTGALILSTFVLTGLISRRLIGRLNLLSEDLAKVCNNDLSRPLSVRGSDEIGRLGEQLLQFRAQRQLMDKTNALNLINNTQACLITCLMDGTIESVNPIARELLPLGNEPEQSLLWQAFPPAAAQQLASQFAPGSTLQRHGQSHCLLELGSDKQQAFWHFDFRRYEQAGELKTIITITDMTRQELTARELSERVAERTRDLKDKNQQLEQEVERRTQAQNDLLRAQDELIQAAKMAVLGQAMTSMAHELNQPLSAISTFLYTSRMAAEQGDMTLLSDNLERIGQLSQRMHRIVGALKEFARKTPAIRVREALSLGAVADSALLLLAPRIKRDNVQVESRLEANLSVIGDPVEIEQVLINLLVNALDAIASCEHRHILIEQLPQPGSTLIAIRDTGPGFPEAVLQKLFSPFVTTKEVGLGLGLSICRTLMERQEGDIRLACTMEGNTLMLLEFPHVPSA
ncbi:ATP-binding protein [Shewanella khirikhana]|uniref:histidine kinase n=1 Tax=Shewanella khirikhana TaxID=1965282 RepID=A0ABM7DRA6_9GAMM|nr:ATP-binding protein [Shewanella khirikhana]AZQ12230.1 Phosphoglycerate transport system sensor protein PgtB [Shewanella khirikhana]